MFKCVKAVDNLKELLPQNSNVAATSQNARGQHFSCGLCITTPSFGFTLYKHAAQGFQVAFKTKGMISFSKGHKKC